MCVAIVGRVEEVEGTRARVNVSGNIIIVEAGLVKVKVGDYVLVHAGCAIEVLEEGLARDMESLFKEIEDAYYDKQ